MNDDRWAIHAPSNLTLHAMRRFVLLLHECPDDRPRPTHCDLMLEYGETLQTWSLGELPCDWRTLEGDAASSTFAAIQHGRPPSGSPIIGLPTSTTKAR